MDFNSWLQGPGFGARSESDPYGLGDYGTGSVVGNSGYYKYGDESQDSFLQRLYGAASNPNSGFGTEARSFADMQSAGLYNNLAPVNINGEMRSRIGENLNETLGQQTGDIQAYFNARGGPGAAYDPTYGWTMPTQDYETLNKFRAYNTRKMSGFSDWAPTLFAMAVTAGVPVAGAGAAAAGGAAGAGAAAGAAEGGAAGGAFGLSEGTIGSLARGAVSTAGSQMQGGSATNGLIGLAGTAAGGYLGGGADASWGANARDGASMADYDNWDSSFGGNTYDYNFDYSNPSGYTGGAGLDAEDAGIGQGMSSGYNYGNIIQDAGNNPGLLDLILKYGGGAAKLLTGGNGSDASALARLLGGLGSAGLGYAGGQAQIQAYKDMQERFLGLGAPSRARLEASYAPGFDLAASDPAYQGAMDQSANAVLRKLSASGGNPWDSPGALMEANKYVTQNTALPQLNTYRSANASSGGLGVNTAGTAAAGMAGAAGGPYDAIGAGLYNMTKQPSALEELAQKYRLVSGWN